MAKHTYHSGWECFSPAPGSHETMVCRVCGHDMAVERNVDGPTGFAEAMGRMKHLHDWFYCKSAGEPWHEQVLALRQLLETTPSRRLADLYEDDIRQIMLSRKPTKDWSRF